jgi:GH15 family glucan-1,4-alpha-glucosidase
MIKEGVYPEGTTLEEIVKTLTAEVGEQGFYYRYIRKDDFGTPQAAFVVCSFWITQALANLKKHKEAHAVLTKAVQSANSLGLYSEHFSPATKTQLGNFPQAYSHVGLINAAFAVSPSWSEVL